MKKNVWHSIEQRTIIDASTDQKHSRLKTRIGSEGGHSFLNTTEVNLGRKQRNNILREHLP